MKRLALITLPIVCLSTPVLAADLGPGYDGDVAVVRPAPRVIERERIVERYYAAPREVFVEPREAYVEPRVYYGPRPYAYAGYGAYWRHGGYWRHHRRGW
jgi:hypothetical protein